MRNIDDTGDMSNVRRSSRSTKGKKRRWEDEEYETEERQDKRRKTFQQKQPLLEQLAKRINELEKEREVSHRSRSVLEVAVGNNYVRFVNLGRECNLFRSRVPVLNSAVVD